MYQCITVDGKISKKKEMSLEDMQKFVGGYIEYVRVGEINIICNEEGRLPHMNLKQNKTYPQFVGNVIIERR